MKEIPLTRGKVALVDDEDYEWLTQSKWCARKIYRTGKWYPHRNPGRLGSPNRRPSMMHRAIALHHGLPMLSNIDHWNGDGLDNRKCNLRPCDQGHNNANQPVRRGRQFKGVCRRGNLVTRPFNAQISNRKGGMRSLGYYSTMEEAAKAYDDAARQQWGAFACCNFARPGERSAVTGQIVPRHDHASGLVVYELDGGAA